MQGLIRITAAASPIVVAVSLFTSPAASAAQGGPSGGALLQPPGYTQSAQDAAREASKVNEASAQVEPFSTGVTSKVLGLTFQKQSTNYYCVPASGRAMLTSFTSSLPSQATLASKMGTTTSGTYMAKAPAVLNEWAGAFYVYDTTVGTKSGLWSRTTSDVSSYNAGLMARMLFGDTPWRSTTETTGHAVVDYGWYKDPNNLVQSIYFWDPWDSTKHLSDYSAAFYSIADAGFGMVW